MTRFLIRTVPQAFGALSQCLARTFAACPPPSAMAWSACHLASAFESVFRGPVMSPSWTRRRSDAPTACASPWRTVTSAASSRACAPTCPIPAATVGSSVPGDKALTQYLKSPIYNNEIITDVGPLNSYPNQANIHTNFSTHLSLRFWDLKLKAAAFTAFMIIAIRPSTSSLSTCQELGEHLHSPSTSPLGVSRSAQAASTILRLCSLSSHSLVLGSSP